LPSSSTEIPPAHASQTAGTSGTTPDSDFDTLHSELGFTVPLLIQYPKCYWIWNYRTWILEQAIHRLPTPKARALWEEELGLVGKMLHRDQRNFHAWGYRRHVVAKLESPALAGKSLVEPEFEYTNKMIKTNLSNFSAWHNRSQLIPRLLRERNADDAARKKFLDEGKPCIVFPNAISILTSIQNLIKFATPSMSAPRTNLYGSITNISS
jgi:geranylgeranyl transferase type-2 subunit alpha